MILMAGGINIFGDASLAGKDIDPEQILTEDPDLIVKIYAGKNVIGNSGVFTAPPQEEFAEKADEMLQRPGWKDLKAVKEGNFYLNTAFMSGGLGKMIGAAYMAKWLYPDLMTDLDPDAIFTQWMKYQGFEPKRTSLLSRTCTGLMTMRADDNQEKRDLAGDYLRRARRKNILLAVLLLVLLVAAIWAACLGVAQLTPDRMIVTWLPSFSGMFKGVAPLDAKEQNVLLMLRLPRIAAAVIAGAGLGIAGSGMQAITGNPMASPFTTGLSSAAAFGAALMILFGGFPLWMQKGATVAAAFVMSVICAIVVYTVASYKQLRPEALVLTGIALNYLFNALNSTMQFIANEQQLPAIVHWSFGSLTAVTWSDIGIMLFFFAVSFPVFMSQAWAFNLLDDGGDETARALGINVKRTRLLCGGAVTLLTASVVSFTGIIGFVGLVAPHMARMLIGGDYRHLLPYSAVTGAFLVLAADTLGRNAFSPTTVPVGIVVSAAVVSCLEAEPEQPVTAIIAPAKIAASHLLLFLIFMSPFSLLSCVFPFYRFIYYIQLFAQG